MQYIKFNIPIAYAFSIINDQRHKLNQFYYGLIPNFGILSDKRFKSTNDWWFISIQLKTVSEISNYL